MASSLSTCAADSTDDLAVAVFWTAISIFGIISNTLLVVAILRNRKLRQSTTYWLIVSLATCDLGMLLVSVFLILPSTVFHDSYIGVNTNANAITLFVYDSFWYSGVLHLFLMAVNRYVSICFPSRYPGMFSATKAAYQIAFICILGVAISVPGLFDCCQLVYNHCMYRAQYTNPASNYAYVDIFVDTATILAMLVCYSSIIAHVRRSRSVTRRYRLGSVAAARRRTLSLEQPNNGMRRRTMWNTRTGVRNRELRLFFQFCCVSAIFLLAWTTWQFLTFITNQSKWVGFISTTLFFMNNCTNPAIYLTFSSVLRREITTLFRLCKKPATVTMVDRTARLLTFPVNHLTMGSIDSNRPLLQPREATCWTTIYSESDTPRTKAAPSFENGNVVFVEIISTVEI